MLAVAAEPALAIAAYGTAQRYLHDNHSPAHTGHLAVAVLAAAVRLYALGAAWTQNVL
jgi:hypothetical protein